MNQDVIEVECRLTMNYDILKSQTSVHYKYYVNISSRKDEYEYLHDAPGGGSIKNRCLKVTRQEAERGMKLIIYIYIYIYIRCCCVILYMIEIQ